MSRRSTDHRERSRSPRKRGESSGANGEFLDEGNGVETEGSDGDGSFLGSDVDSVVEMEAVDEGNSKQEWQVKTKGKKKENKRGHDDVHTELDKDSDAKRVARQIDLKVKVQFDSPSSINPLKITKALHEAVGTVRVTPLRGGSLIIECSNITQRDKLLGVNEMEGKKIKCIEWERKKLQLGVVTGVSTDLSCEDILRNVSGANVVKCRRLMYTREQVKKESLSILLFFDEKVLPIRIRVGYMSFQVRPYIPPPLQCFQCQKFGHVAAICRGKKRCGKCGGEDHEYGQCQEGVSVKCCNCGGSHSAAYKGCQAHNRAAEVQRVKVEEKLTYAEAIQKVDGKRKAEIGPQGQSHYISYQRSKETSRPTCKEMIQVDSVKFLAFLAEVINCTALTEKKSEKIKIIVNAARRHFSGGAEVSFEEISRILNIQQGVQSASQPASCGSS